MPTKFDLQSENFDYYFYRAAQNIATADKAALPSDVRKWMKLNRLPFLGKLFILWKCLKKRYWIIVEDEVEGISLEKFVELRKAQKKRDVSSDKAGVLVSAGDFVAADKEFGNTLAYLNNLSESGAYRYLQHIKNLPPNRIVNWAKEMIYISKFLVRFEGQKKNWMLELNLNMPEFYVMMYLYPGEEVLGSIMYHDVFRKSVYSSTTQIKLAFGTLQEKGYVIKTGTGRGAKLRITGQGISTINYIITKYAVNC